MKRQVPYVPTVVLFVVLVLLLLLLAISGAQAQVTTPVTAGKICFGSCSSGPTDNFGTASTPEGSVAACVGSTYRKTNGTTDTALWKKETGTCTSSGWVAIGASGGGSTPNFTTLRVGNNTPVLTSPTRGFDFRYLHSGSLGSSVFHGGSFDTTFTPSGSWSGNGIGMYFRTGTTAQTHSANLYGIVSEVSSTSSGTETGTIGFNMNLTRTGGTTTFGIGGEYGLTAGASGTISNAIGMQVLAPVETGGGVITTATGIKVQNQTIGTTDEDLRLEFANSGVDQFLATGQRNKTAAWTGTLGSTSFAGDNITTTFTPTGSSWTGQSQAIHATSVIAGSQAATQSYYAGLFQANSTANATITEEIGIRGEVNRSTAGTTTYATGVSSFINANNAAITNAYGLRAYTPTETGTGAITNNWGLYIADQTVTGATSRAMEIVYSTGGSAINANGTRTHNLTFTSDPGALAAFDNNTVTYTGGAPTNHLFGHLDRLTVDPSADITSKDIYANLSAGVVQSTSAHQFRTVAALYASGASAGNDSVTAWSAVDGGGIFGIIGDFNHYGTGTIALGADVMAWSGTGTGSTTTNKYRFYVPQMYDYSGTVTTHVGLQIDDQATGASGITNNWLIRAQAPSSKDFRVRADGALTLGGVLYTFPASDSSGCLQSNGSGTLSWGSCAGSSGYTTVADEGSNLTARATVNFTGAGVSCVDNGGATRTDCTISGGAAATETTGITVDGGGSVFTTGVKGFNVVPKAGTITSVTLLSTDAAATACSVVFNILKDTYANYPPVVGDAITASAKPTLSSANKSRDTTLTGWTTSVSAGDILGYTVDSVTGCTRVTLVLEIQ